MATYTLKQLRNLIKSLSFNDNGKIVLNIGKVGDDEYQAMMVTKDGAPFDLIYAIPALSVVKASAWAKVSGAEASVNWWGVLVDD